MLGLIGISTKYVSILDCRIKVVFYEISLISSVIVVENDLLHLQRYEKFAK